MNILSSLFRNELAIDLGTVNTIIYAPGRGLLLNEPSVVALDRYDGDVLYVGSRALKLLGREPRDIEVHRPIRSGTIFNFEVTQKMLKSFLNKATDGYRRGHFVVGVPGSSTAVEQRSIRDAARDSGGYRVDLVDEGLAAGLGAGLDPGDERAHLIVDVGGGTTNIAIIASGGVVSSLTLTAAGNEMDEAIRDYIRSKYCLHIGESSAERVKRELGSLLEDEIADEESVEVIGKHIIDGSANAVEVTAGEIREALQPVLAEIVAGVHHAIEEAHPEAIADIYRLGIILTGGGALMKGLPERLQEELNLQVTVPDNPMAMVALGAGSLIAAREILQRASIRQDLPVWEKSEELVVTW
ncbi:MAG TPA: rod shape-determining protein [Pyrinomonadaceae bacterium]|jgi:rod shape-determining protein MreB